MTFFVVVVVVGIVDEKQQKMIQRSICHSQEWPQVKKAEIWDEWIHIASLSS